MERDSVRERHTVRLAAWLGVVLVLAGLNYLGRFLSEGAARDDLAYRWSTSVALVAQSAFLLGVMLLITIGLSKRDLLALHGPRSWWRALGLTALALVAIFALAIVYGQLLSLGGWDAAKEQGLVPEDWDSSRLAPFVAFFLGVTVLVPVVEEVTFRGLGMSLLLPWGAVVAVLGSGLLFGLAHGLLLGLPLLAAFGIVNALLRMRTASLYPPILMHGAFNGISLALSVAGA